MSTTSERGRWGRFGGRFTAEALWEPLEEVARAFDAAILDEDFTRQFHQWLDHRIGRPTPLTRLGRLSAQLGGATLWAKREDLCQGGSYCGNLAMFYALLARRLGRKTLVGESASGDFGVALGAAGAALGLSVRVFMGRDDISREPLRVAQMKRLGVSLEPVDASRRGRRLPGSEAMRAWLSDSNHLLYASSMLTSPDPYPRLIAHVLRSIGAETRVQIERRGVMPDYLIAPVGTGAFAAGLFEAFVDEERCQLVGIQAGGEAIASRHSASLISGGVGVFQGTFSHVLQDENGQLLPPYSVAGGLCAAGVGPQHAWWASQGDVIYASINDEEALHAWRVIARVEGVSVALEAAHALSYAMKLAPTLDPTRHIIVGISGSGDRDMARAITAQEER